MPYIGVHDGEKVSPLDVRNKQRVKCPKCEGTMGVRQKHVNDGRLIPRHFYHIDQETECTTGDTQENITSHQSGGHKSGGGGEAESEVHNKMKVFAYQSLSDRFPDADIEYEKGIGSRIGDVCVKFNTPKHPLGKGIVVEAQFKHKDKDRGAVQREFLSHGYSVYWMYLSDIVDAYTVNFKEHRLQTVWPKSVPQVESWSDANKESDLLDDITVSEYPIMCLIPPNIRKDEIINYQHPEEFARDIVPFLGKAWVHSKGRVGVWFELYDTPADIFLFTLTKLDRKTKDREFATVGVTKDSIEELRYFVEETEYTNPFQTDGIKSYVEVVTVSFSETQIGEGWLSLLKTSNRPKLVLGRRGKQGNTHSIGFEWKRGDIYRFEENVLRMFYQATHKPEDKPYYLGKNK